jgi:hypothetical protein
MTSLKDGLNNILTITHIHRIYVALIAHHANYKLEELKDQELQYISVFNARLVVAGLGQ